MSQNQGTRPSQYLTITDPWLAYQVDRCVNVIGTVVSNAAQEFEKLGEGENTSYEPKYTMDQLLDPDYKLPRPKTAEDKERDSLQALKALARGGKRSGVKVFKAKPQET